MLKEIYQTALQSFVSVSVLFVLTRILGKKQISQLTFFDYVAGISIGSVAATFAVDNSIGYTRGLTGLLVFAIIPILLSYISLKSYIGRKLLDGQPSILIQNGKIVESNLQKTKMNINDLLEECRVKNAFNISDIEFAILETSGKLSVLLKSENQPLTPKDMNTPVKYKGLCMNVIIDGKLLEDNLKTINHDKEWINSELKDKGISMPEVLLAFVDSQDNFHFHLKNDSPPVTPIF